MKIKLYILTFFILLSEAALGQASGNADFYFTVKFEKDIPIEEIEVSYYVARNNSFSKINYKLNISENEIELFGRNHFVVGSDFPLILFSYKEKKIFETDFREAEDDREVQNIFYLIIQKDYVSKDYDYFDKELKFSKGNPNIIVRCENNNGKLDWYISNEPSHFLSPLKISNELVKVKPIEE